MDRRLRTSLVTVLLLGGILGAVGAALYGPRAGLSVCIGAGVASANLFALAKLVTILVPADDAKPVPGGVGPWMLVGLLKMILLTYLVAMLFHRFPALAGNMGRLKQLVSGTQVADSEGATLHHGESFLASLFIVLLLILCALSLRKKLVDYERSVIPEEKLSLRTFFEVFIGYFYGMMKDMMGPRRAKQFFPLVGTAACFIFFSNILGLIPGFLPPTSSWNITLGCALVIFVAFNYYGIKENGWRYVAHFAGPVWWLAPLLFPIELFSMLIRPMTLSIRLMLNMAVDHLLLGVVVGMVALLVPIPIMVLGTLVALIQTLVFCLLSSVYIALATEEHDHGHAADGHMAAAHP
jgi:F-type H+-transporting ATPase subunit a